MLDIGLSKNCFLKKCTPQQLMEAVSSGKVNDVRVLLSEGADPNAFPPMVTFYTELYQNIEFTFTLLQIQFTPLMEACKTGDVKMAQLLLDNNADPNIGNDVSVL